MRNLSLLFVTEASDNTAVIGQQSFNSQSSIMYDEFQCVAQLVISFLLCVLIFICSCLSFRAVVATQLWWKCDTNLFEAKMSHSIWEILKPAFKHSCKQCAVHCRLQLVHPCSSSKIFIDNSMLEAWSYTIATIFINNSPPFSYFNKLTWNVDSSMSIRESSCLQNKIMQAPITVKVVHSNCHVGFHRCTSPYIGC